MSATISNNLPTLSNEGGLSAYLDQIKKFPMLAAEEEYMLAKNWKTTGNIKAAEKLVTSHLRLVAKIAMGYKGYGLPVNEMISEGNIGLMQAVKKFEPEKGFRLATYAMWWIKASIQEYILRSWSLVKIGTTTAQKKLFFNLKKLKNQNIHDQERIDSILIKLDGTKQKTKLGANTILAVSMAVKKLSAKVKKIPLFKNFIIKKNFKLPFPLMNIINGGAHANNGLRIQEFMIRPDKAKSFSEAMRMCYLVIKNLSKLIKAKGLATSVGDEGGFAPMIKNNNQALDLIVLSIKKSGFRNGKDFSICLDVAAMNYLKKVNILFTQKNMFLLIKQFQNTKK